MNTFSDFRANHFEKYNWLCDQNFASWIVENIETYGDSILDVGVGNGFMLPFYTKAFKIVGAIEPCEELRKKIENDKRYENIIIKDGQAESIPFQENSYDFVISKSSLHHFSDIKKGLLEMKRTARIGIGIVEVIAPCDICISFLEEILLMKEKKRDISSIYTEKRLEKLFQLYLDYEKLFQLHYDQYIDVEKWVKYSDLNKWEQKELLDKIQGCHEDLKRILHIHVRDGRLVMLRRMCLNILQLKK